MDGRSRMVEPSVGVAPGARVVEPPPAEPGKRLGDGAETEGLKRRRVASDQAVPPAKRSRKEYLGCSKADNLVVERLDAPVAQIAFHFCETFLDVTPSNSPPVSTPVGTIFDQYYAFASQLTGAWNPEMRKHVVYGTSALFCKMFLKKLYFTEWRSRKRLNVGQILDGVVIRRPSAEELAALIDVCRPLVPQSCAPVAGAVLPVPLPPSAGRRGRKPGPKYRTLLHRVDSALTLLAGIRRDLMDLVDDAPGGAAGVLGGPPPIVAPTPRAPSDTPAVEKSPPREAEVPLPALGFDEHRPVLGKVNEPHTLGGDELNSADRSRPAAARGRPELGNGAPADKEADDQLSLKRSSSQARKRPPRPVK